ncbi:MAG: S46 family peptidase [Ignavibacteriales bacterium]|nr:S46 family peptidase [Ignavibacteriales bacterium]
MKRFLSLFVVVVFLFQPLHSQFNFNADTVKAGKYDTGRCDFRISTFDYLKEKYGFEAAKEWFDDVRLSALRISGCSASLVSGDGLVMTNNHCARGVQRQVQKEGEELAKTGFYATTSKKKEKYPTMLQNNLCI